MNEYGTELDLTIDMITSDFDSIEIDQHYHLLLCDLMLGNHNGIDLGKKLFSNYQIDDIAYISANSNLVFDVLPYDPLFFVRKSNLEEDLDVLMSLFKKKNNSNRLIEIKHQGRIKKIHVGSILYIEVEDRSLHFYTTDGDMMHFSNLKDFIDQLDEYKFIQVNRYTVINLDYMISYGAENVYMKDGKEILLGRKYRSTFKQKYMEYLL